MNENDSPSCEIMPVNPVLFQFIIEQLLSCPRALRPPGYGGSTGTCPVLQQLIDFYLLVQPLAVQATLRFHHS